jgi:hypothetical protein
VALVSTQPLTEMSTRNLPGDKGRKTPKANKLTAICEQIFKGKCGSLDISQPHGHSRAVTGIALLFYLLLYVRNADVNWTDLPQYMVRLSAFVNVLRTT